MRTPCCHDNARETQREARWETQKTAALLQDFVTRGEKVAEKAHRKRETKPKTTPLTLLREHVKDNFAPVSGESSTFER